MRTTDLEPEAGLVVYRDGGGIDAIAEHSKHLVSALCDLGTPAKYAAAGLKAVWYADVSPAWVLLQYNPLSYGRWGVAPALIRDAILARRRTAAPLIVLVHEPWVDVLGWRSALMNAYQRVQLRSLLAVADGVIATTEHFARVLGPHTAHIPVGANVMPHGVTAARARAQLGLDGLVISLFGRANPSRALDYAEGALARLAASAEGFDLTVLNIGDLAPQLAVPPGVELRNTGRMDANELSVALCASDMLLLPFTDGVSTRRTTLMAGLAHGVPVVGLRGRNTDRILSNRSEALALSPVGDRTAFAETVVALARDRVRLRALGHAGRRLYLEEFDWPIVASRVHGVINGSR